MSENSHLAPVNVHDLNPPILLQNIDGCNFYNTNFTQAKKVVNIKCIAPDPIETLLLGHAALGALHDSQERFDPPKCHPGTRKMVLERIESWACRKARDKPILWLSGAAGAGKSAIAQTFAERWKQRSLLAACFFFGRSACDRNHNRKFVATIVYQLAVLIPSIRPSIQETLQKDPGIFEKSLITQISNLVIQPLSRLEATVYSTMVVVVDGLDECSLDSETQPHQKQQRELLEAIVAVTQARSKLKLRFLIVSRPEHQLRENFQSDPLQSLTSILYLDDSHNPNADIEQFLRSSFAHIRKRHSISDTSWPSDSILSTLVQKSSGQFIYASTVVKYVRRTQGDPRTNLAIILGLRPRPEASENPFKELDMVYTHILHSVPKESLDAMKWIIESLLFVIREWRWSHINPFPRLCPCSPRFLEKLFFMAPDMIYACLNNLHSILEIPPQENSTTLPIRFIHASFGEFLTDSSRSGQFHVDKTSARVRCQLNLLRHVFSISSTPWHDPIYDEEGIIRAFVWGLWFDTSSPDYVPPIELKKGLEAAMSNDDRKYFAHLNEMGITVLGDQRKLRLRSRLAPYQQRWVLKFLQRCNIKKLEPSRIRRWIVGFKLRRQISHLPEAEYMISCSSPVVPHTPGKKY